MRKLNCPHQARCVAVLQRHVCSADKCRAPAAGQPVHPEHDERRQRRTDRRAAVEERHGPSALALWEPLGHCLGRARPVCRLAGPQEEAAREEAPEAPGQRRQHGHRRVPRHRETQAAPRTQHIDQAAPDELNDGVGDAKGDDNRREVAVGPEVLSADRISINVGGRAAVPAIPGLVQIGYLTNSSVLDLDFLPPHLLVLGGSYIGLQFGQMYRRFGSGVAITANLLQGERRRVSDRITAHALYTDPPLGRAGMTETEARKLGKRLLIGHRPMTHVGRAVEEPDVAAVIAGIRQSGAIEETREKIAGYARRAENAIDRLENTAAKAELQRLAGELLEEAS